MAMALLDSEQPEPEGASALGAEAINVVRYMRIESIRQRTRDLVRTLRPWKHVPSVAALIADASSWLATDLSGNATR